MEQVETGAAQSPETTYQRKGGYVVRAFMDEFLMIPVAAPDADHSKMAVLSPVAEFIWTLIETPHTFGEILTAVTEEFDVDVETAVEDTQAFLQELQAYHLLENQTEETQYDHE